MENIVSTIQRLFAAYGFQAGIIIIATIIITNLIKSPIMKVAIKYAEKTGYDKSVITKYITFIPLAVCTVLIFLVTLISNDWSFVGISWGELTAQAAVYAAIASATYEAIKKQLEAYATKRNSKVALEEAPTTTEPTPEGAAPEDTAQVSTTDIAQKSAKEEKKNVRNIKVN